ncbi:Retrotransposon gag protein [Corchorus olitorius]|uniref:Retrotransposon gag protein n=1 Tax=Corchorus olitorius TaxID=93759 RepID=A0A1R3GW22_9ROSI|nr:Retrotransposon gag protein [Corchorus olitorius]
MQSNTTELRSEIHSSFEKVSSDLKQFMVQCLQKPSSIVDLTSASKSPMNSNSSDFNTHSSSNRPYTKHSKIECPRFDGSDFMGWYHRILQFFEADSTPEETRIRTFMMHLEGRALQWHINFMRVAELEGQVTWHNYVLAMRERFGCNQYRNPLSELIALKQTASVDDYYDKLESILNLLKLSDENAMSFFITNLKPELRQQVELSQPKKLAQAVNYARHVESLMNGSATLAFTAMPSAFKSFLNPNTTPKQTTYTQRTQHKLPSLAPPSNQQGLLAYPSPKQNSPTETNPTNTTKNSYVPTRAERDERKKKGLCMWCAAKFVPGHKCGVKAQLYQMFLEETTGPSTDSEAYVDCADFIEETGQTSTDAETTPIITLHALLGCKGPQTMSIAGKIKNQMQGLTQQSAVFLIPLLGCDMVLGIQWLKTLGPICHATPYEIVHGQPPPVHIPYLPGESNVDTVDRSLAAREATIQLLKFHFQRAQNRTKQQADKKRHVGKHPTQAQLPLIDAEGHIAKEPVAVLDKRITKRHNRAVTEVLISWSNAFAEDATWELLYDIQKKFPNFNP